MSGKIAAAVIAALLAAVTIISSALFTGCFRERAEFIVGKDIKISELTELYYTYATSTDPSEYLRYRFYTENGMYFVDYDKREGSHWPLTESDRTDWGTVLLSEEQWNSLFSLLDSGTVTKRHESTESGDSGPWTYLYWTGDGSKYQEFTFAPGALVRFEAFAETVCEVSDGGI